MARANRHSRQPTTDCYAPKKTIRALTEAQGHYILAIKNKVLTFGIGAAGSGKTMVATALACDAFIGREIEQIIITRPVVDAGNSLGFLPGMESEKYSPYLTPLLDILQIRLGRSQLEYAMKVGQIKAIPLEKMRGLSFHDTWVILDEAQNVTKQQMKMFLTRIGRNCKVIVNGDPDQCDLKAPSGLVDAVERLSGLPDVGVVEFDINDIVRSGIVKDILIRYCD